MPKSLPMPRFQSVQRAAAAAVLAWLAGCATPGADHVATAAVGRVSETLAGSTSPAGSDVRARTSISAGVGSGGAVGGIALGLIFGGQGEPAHTVYVLTLADHSRRFVRSQAVFATGDCVAVLTTPDLVSQSSWALGQATLVPSLDCP